MSIINFDIIKHPMNWIIVLLMLLIFGFAADVLLSQISTSTD